MQPLKFRNGSVISFHTSQGVWLFIHAGASDMRYEHFSRRHNLNQYLIVWAHLLRRKINITDCMDYQIYNCQEKTLSKFKWRPMFILFSGVPIYITEDHRKRQLRFLQHVTWTEIAILPSKHLKYLPRFSEMLTFLRESHHFTPRRRSTLLISDFVCPIRKQPK